MSNWVEISDSTVFDDDCLSIYLKETVNCYAIKMMIDK